MLDAAKEHIISVAKTVVSMFRREGQVVTIWNRDFLFEGQTSELKADCMSEIFISYARSTANEAQAVSEALRALGYRVWRDDELPAHRNYADVIEERLRSAKAVVVIWSAEAAKSQWVRAEADLAREAGTLVQLNIDGVILPLPFNQIQCADLANWRGEAEHSGWRKIVSSVAELIAGIAPALPPPRRCVASRTAPCSPSSPLTTCLAIRRWRTFRMGCLRRFWTPSRAART